MSDIGTLLTTMQTSLRALTHSGGGKAFTQVLLSIDEVSRETFYSMPVAVLGNKEVSNDAENPELGTELIWVDIWTRDASTPGGKEQLVGERGCNDLVEKVRAGLAHQADGNWMAGLRITRISAPFKREVPNIGFVWNARVTWEVIKG
jgi:hypothetical protein